ncbi:hypothetical protein LguiB_031360 [Lonicera macranthoides]
MLVREFCGEYPTLIGILGQLGEDVKVIAGQFLGYVVENHHVSREPASIFQAFQLSMCWIAASLLKHKIDRKESLSLAKEHLQFVCKEEEAESVYSKLRLLKKEFLSHNENIIGTDFPKVPTKLTTEDATKQAPNAQVSTSLPFIPKDVKVEIVERSQIEEFSEDQVRFKTGSEEISDLIKSIQRKCEKRMVKLLQKQQDEIQEFHKIWDDKRSELEDDHRLESAVVRRIHRNISGRLDKLKVLDKELEMKMKEHNRQKDISLKDLEAKQLHARNDEREKAAHWLAKAKSSAIDVDPAPTARGAAPPGTTENVLNGPDIGIRNALVNQIPENNEVISEKGTQNALGNLDYEKTVSTGPPCLEKQIPDGNISSVHGEEITSKLPETVLCGLGNFDPVKMGTPAAESDQVNARTDAVSFDTPNVVANLSNEANNSSNNGDLPSLVNVPSVQPVIYLTSEQPLPQILERQNECPQSLESTEMRDECAPDQPNQSSSQVQIPPLDNIDHNHSDLPPAAGAAPELQGPTSIPSQNVADLPPAGGPTPELQGPTISQNIDNLCPASGSTLELHGSTISQNVSNLPPASGSTSEVQGPTTSQNLANLRAVSGPTPELQELVTSQNVADLPPANGPTPELLLASGPIHELRGPTTYQNVANIPSTSGPELQQSTPLQNAGASTQLADDPTNEAIIQGTNHHPLSHTEQQAAPRMATLPLFFDPLQNELDRIYIEREQTIKSHEDTQKLKLNFEFEKEMEETIAQIRRKYEVKHQDAEVAFLVKKNELDTNHNIVLMNKILAEAFRSKCLDLSPSGPSKRQQAAPSVTSSSTGPTAAAQLVAGPAQRVSTNSSVAPPAATQLAGSLPRVSTYSLAGPPLATQYGSASRGLGVTNSLAVPPLATPQITVPPLQIVSQSAALFSSVPTRPLTINPITPSAGNHRAGGGEIRAPAPHLQFRPPPMPTPNATPPLRAMPCPSPPPASPPRSMMAPPPLLPPLATNSSGITCRTPQREGTGGLQTLTYRPLPPSSMMAPPPPPQLPPLATNSSNLASRPPQPEGTNGLQTPCYSLSALELMMDMDRRPNANVHHPNFMPPLPDFDSNFSPLDLSEFEPPVTTQVSSTPPTVAADVVCLSDDDN